MNSLLLRLHDFFKHGIMCDIKIVSIENNKTISAHRLILSMYSKYFYNIFNSDFIDKNNDEIYICADYDILYIILEFMYTGNIVLTKDNIELVIQVCDYLCIDSLIKICEEYICGIIDETNCIHLLNFSDTYNLQRLREMSKWYLPKIINNNKLVVELDIDDMILIIKEIKYIACEYIVKKIILNWIDHKDERIIYTKKLMKHINDQDHYTSLSDIELYNNIRERIYDNKEHDVDISHNFIIMVGGKKIFNITAFNPLSNKKHIIDRYDDMFGCKTHFSVVYLNSILYIIGGKKRGYFTKEVLSYNIKNKLWCYEPELNYFRYDTSVCVSNGMIYSIGGKDTNGYMTNIVEFWKPEWKSWYDGQHLCYPRCYMSLVDYNNEVYTIGGLKTSITDEFNIEMIVSDDAVEKLTDHSWMKLKQFPIAKSGISSIVYNDFIYCIGGRIDTPHISIEHTNDVYIYSSRDDCWKYLSNTNVKRSFCLSCVFNNELYIIGGYNTNSVEKYNKLKNTWKRLNDIPKFEECVNEASAIYL
ncbi:SPV006 kelch-like protein [Swinepox virus]|uniref:SPV006 kelch-like protein n=1 Tax=Swinepox virus (strain Swine/Nebraska/17077-99/1999) TaxID=300880 RepID=Q8V3S6_SWPV1|nr:SPV006 kelch-like protein [Swinepox virus]AAL69745.1 SPV006 kelch-like protein [Swinepox virus]UED36562.1 SPV006 kelch-like protein [Swinepox virus]UED36711.1 SPV006 kelch-like protein [Swinepox virus]UUA44196.1 SPV006 [Swinepox virus]